MAKSKYELVFCIINNGFSDLVMDAARKEGATGGTIFHGRGTGNKEMENFFGVTVTPEKEIVLIVVDPDKKDQVVSAIYKDAGLNTKGQGIVFTLPVDDFVGPNILNNK